MADAIAGVLRDAPPLDAEIALPDELRAALRRVYPEGAELELDPVERALSWRRHLSRRDLMRAVVDLRELADLARTAVNGPALKPPARARPAAPRGAATAMGSDPLAGLEPKERLLVQVLRRRPGKIRGLDRLVAILEEGAPHEVWDGVASALHSSARRKLAGSDVELFGGKDDPGTYGVRLGNSATPENLTQ